MRWIVFDGQSAKAVADEFGMAAEVRDGGDALGAALAAENASFVLLPDPGINQVLVARVRRKTPARTSEPQVAYTGFLGLIDQTIYEDEPSPPKKWWQRILD